MSIPKYEKAPITLEAITDDIIDATVEELEFGAIDTGIARESVYLYLTSLENRNEDFPDMRNELLKSDYISEKDTDIRCEVKQLAYEVEHLIEIHAITTYETSLSISAISKAAEICGITVSEKIYSEHCTCDVLRVMLAQLAVCGDDDYLLGRFFEAHPDVSMEQLKQLADAYSE